MTANEIKKTLECCIVSGSCDYCPFNGMINFLKEMGVE